MKQLTTFSWGYWGWGTSTNRLVEAFDTAERAQGFEPPLFVDVRLERTGQAPDFRGNAFEKTLNTAKTRRGMERNYVHMSSLGNLGIRTKSKIKIKELKAAKDLLDEVIIAAKQNRRVIFFCACQVPRTCHRRVVADLVLKAAKRRNVPIQIVEWPGGEPREIDLQVPDKVFLAVLEGKRKTIPLGQLGDQLPLAEAVALPWCSLAFLQTARYNDPVIVGPAIFKKDEWVLPVIDSRHWGTVSGFRKGALFLRKKYGWHSRS